MTEQLVESWRIHNRINLFLLDAVKAAQLEIAPASKERNVGQLFAHIHNVRIMWLKSAAPDLLDRVEKLDLESLTHPALVKALTDSGVAIEMLLQRSLSNGGRVKGFKPHATAFLCYLITHEAHHRGQAALILRLSGQPLDKKVAYGIWEWGTR